MKSPIKPTIKTEIFPISLIALAGLLSTYFYTHFPEKVAGHWDFAGAVDRYTNRAEGAFVMPIILLLMYVMFLLVPYFDPKQDRYAQFKNVYHIFKNLIMSMFLAIYVITGLFNLGYPIKVNLLVPGLVGFLMIVIGNFMGKIKNNWFMGIRTPWTLSSENVWNKTHRLGGWLFVLWGIAIIITPYLPKPLGLTLFLGGAGVVVLGTAAYSYYLYKKEG